MHPVASSKCRNAPVCPNRLLSGKRELGYCESCRALSNLLRDIHREQLSEHTREVTEARLAQVRLDRLRARLRFTPARSSRKLRHAGVGNQ